MMKTPTIISSTRLRGMLCGERGEDRCAEHDAERVGGDELAGERDRDGEIARDVGQQAHHHELGRADAEGAHGERQHRDRNAAPHGDWRRGLGADSSVPL